MSRAAKMNSLSSPPSAYTLSPRPQPFASSLFPNMGTLAAAAAIQSASQLHGPAKNPTLTIHLNSRCLCSPGALTPPVRRLPSWVRVQRRPENNAGGGDTDEVFDELFFQKYGKVAYRSGDQKPPIAEADDDAESLSFAVTLAKVADEVKAADIRVLFVKPLVYWTRFFIIVTAFSRPQVDAIGSRMRDMAEKQFKKVASGDTKPNSWTLLDFGDVVVHIFLPEQRAYYDLEEFYGNATVIEVPFDTQPPLRRS